MNRNQILTCFFLLTLLIFVIPSQYDSLVLDNSLQSLGDANETFPIIHPPSDTQFTEGEVGHSLIWGIEYNYSLSYTIYRNGTAIYFGQWSEGPVEISLDNLLPGLYLYSMYIPDAANHFVRVTVLSTSSANISSPMNPLSVVNIGFVGIISVFVILILKHKNEKKM